MDKLQWGNRKRLRCFKVKDSTSNGKSDGGRSLVVKKKITSRVLDNNKESGFPPPMSSPHRLGRDLGVNRSNANEHRKTSVSSPEKEDRYYTTRGSVGVDDSSKLLMEAREEKKKMVWPKLLITLSSKEKEEDFMAMKGCKLPQRPKKRAKLTQRTVLLVQPGTWLQDLCQERYEVREKKTSKKVLNLLSFIVRTRVRSSKNAPLYFWRITCPCQIIHSKNALLYFWRIQHVPVSDPPKMYSSTFGGSNTHMIVLDEGAFYYYNNIL